MIVTQLAMLGAQPITFKVAPPRLPKGQGRTCVASFLHLGAGRQSSAVAYLIRHGELPRPTAALFADTGDEPSWVYEQVEYLTDLLAEIDIPVVTVRKMGNGLIADATSDGHGRFASMPLYTLDPVTGKVGQLRRQCTREYKIEPITSYIRDWLIAHDYGKAIVDKNGRASRRVDRHIYVEDWYGISYDEWQRAGDRGATWQKAVYPLIDRKMGVKDCIAFALAHGYRIPKKSSCRHCPYHDEEYLLDLKRNHPPDWEDICQFDDWLRTPEAARRFTRKMKQAVYLHRSCQPLRAVDLEAIIASKARGLPLMEMCGSHCGT